MTQIPDCHQPSARGERGDVKEQRVAAVAEGLRVAEPQRRQEKEKKEKEEEDRARQMERNEVTAIFTRGAVNLQAMHHRAAAKQYRQSMQTKVLFFFFVGLHLSATFCRNRNFCCTFYPQCVCCCSRGGKKLCFPGQEIQIQIANDLTEHTRGW